MSRRRKGSGTLCPGERKAFACSRLENPRRARTIPTGRGMFMPSASVSATFQENGSTHMCDEFTEYYPYLLIPQIEITEPYSACLLYTSDAADDLLCVDLGGRRIIKKKKKN